MEYTLGYFHHENEQNLTCNNCHNVGTSELKRIVKSPDRSHLVYYCKSCNNLWTKSNDFNEFIEEQFRHIVCKEVEEIQIPQNQAIVDNVRIDTANIESILEESKNTTTNTNYEIQKLTNEIFALTEIVKELINKNDELQEKVSNPLRALRNMVNDFNLE